jgi:hypothetical protein
VVPLLFQEDTAGPEAGVTVEEIVENPEPVVGPRVTVSSEVEEVISTSAFTLDRPTAIGNGLLW